MAHTAPEGYSSNYAALLDLIRFGFGIWTTSQMAALLFHAERSTAQGRDSDQHSQSQAEEGIYSARQLRWVRGPSGISSATWKRANTELLAAGVLRKTRRTNRFGKHDPSEYEIHWPAIAAAIRKWQNTAGTNPFALAQGEPVIGSQRASHWLTVSQTQIKGQSTRMPLAHSEPHSQTDLYSSQSVSHSESDQRKREIAAAIEAASGERPTDRLTSLIAQIGDRLHLPTLVIVRWIHDKCFDVRARGYQLRAGLLAKAAAEDLIGWIKSNRAFVASEQERELLASQPNPAELREMPPAEPAQPNFADELLADIQRKRKKGA